MGIDSLFDQLALYRGVIHFRNERRHKTESGVNVILNLL